MKKFFLTILATYSLFCADISALKLNCQNGDKSSCINFLYANKDQNENVNFTKKLCDEGNFLACDLLGNLYQNALGVQKDDIKAFELYKKSCDGKELEGCLALGSAYLNGIGTKQDLKKGKEILENVAKNGDLRSKTFANFTLFGFDEKTLKSAKELCVNDEYFDSCFLLGLHYLGTNEKDKAKEIFNKICQKGVDFACAEYKKLEF